MLDFISQACYYNNSYEALNISMETSENGYPRLLMDYGGSQNAIGIQRFRTQVQT